VPKAKVNVCPNVGWGKDFFDPQSMLDPTFNGKNIVPSGNVNTAQVNDPKINSEIEKAKTITNPTDRATAWGNLDKQVTDQSYFLTWTWDNYVGLMGTNVKGVQNAFNGGAWDLAYSSLK
jgi:peptide/nickel transport system substrate-binding protein